MGATEPQTLNTSTQLDLVFGLLEQVCLITPSAVEDENRWSYSVFLLNLACLDFLCPKRLLHQLLCGDLEVPPALSSQWWLLRLLDSLPLRCVVQTSGVDSCTC